MIFIMTRRFELALLPRVHLYARVPFIGAFFIPLGVVDREAPWGRTTFVRWSELSAAERGVTAS